jgi:hypothetical protein
MPPAAYFEQMLTGYAITVLIETCVLLAALSRRHSTRVALFAGVWLTACTYPVVWLVFPALLHERWLYLLVAETFAPAAECALFWLAFVRHLPADGAMLRRDLGAIILANLCSFLGGESLVEMGLLFG